MKTLLGDKNGNLYAENLHRILPTLLSPPSRVTSAIYQIFHSVWNKKFCKSIKILSHIFIKHLLKVYWKICCENFDLSSGEWGEELKIRESSRIDFNSTADIRYSGVILSHEKH